MISYSWIFGLANLLLSLLVDRQDNFIDFENKKGRPTLLTYGYAEFSSIEAGETLFEQTKRTGELLAQVCKQAGVRSTQAMAALPTSKVFTTILSLADGKDQRQRQLAVDAEITKLAPLPLS